MLTLFTENVTPTTSSGDDECEPSWDIPYKNNKLLEIIQKYFASK